MLNRGETAAPADTNGILFICLYRRHIDCGIDCSRNNKNIFVAIIVNIEKEHIKGHYLLDLEKEYGLKE